MNDLKILKVDNTDLLGCCLAIRNTVFIEEKQVSREIEVDRYDCLNKKCAHFLIQYGEKDVGAVRCLNISENTVKVQRFCILKEYRNLGFGKTAMEYIENYYKKRGKTEIILDAKFSVCGFYEKYGYDKISDVFTEAGVPHVKMIKNI